MTIQIAEDIVVQKETPVDCCCRHTPGSRKPHAIENIGSDAYSPLIGNSSASDRFRAVFSLVFNTDWSCGPHYPACLLVLSFEGLVFNKLAPTAFPCALAVHTLHTTTES